MQKIIKESVQVEKLESITCDKCKKTHNVDDCMEIQEFHTINFIGGYSSVFGDGAHVKCDLCQDCLSDMIKDIANIS
jgi:hypothetical protein